MNINEAFPSKYVRADDLGASRVAVVIDHVSTELVGQGDDQERKAVVYFRGRSKGLVLNKTNASSILEIAGSAETDDWPGVRLVLYATKVDFQGKRVNAIRVDAPPNGPKPTAAKVAPSEADERPGWDDDIPF